MGLVWHTAAAGEPLPPDTFAGPCSAWVPVNDGAFGTGTGPNSTDYSGEEGFEVVVFNNQLYVGMEADNAYGARLWRTNAGIRVPTGQADWQEVIADEDGNPFDNPNKEQNDHIDSLAVFQGALYASTANRSGYNLGTLVYSSTTGNPGSWTQVISAGFGDVHNANFKDMQIFQGWLCGGTWNERNGAQVWCTADGAQWVQKNHSGFGITGDDNTVTTVWSGHVYSNALYFGVHQALDCSGSTCLPVSVGVLYRTSDVTVASPTWTRVFTGVLESYRVDILGDLDGYLYVATRKPEGIAIYRSICGTPGTWIQVNQDGMNGNPANTGTVVDGATVYNGALYVAVNNTTTGVEIWRTTGDLQPTGWVDWEPVGSSGLDDPENYYSEMVPFNGYLYAWTSNYTTGQHVYRAACPICQTRAIAGSGRFDFDGVGASITVTAGSLGTLTVCTRPGAPPTAQIDARPVARTYHITGTPETSIFTADVTLSYTPQELDASDIGDEASVYLARWTGSTWESCPETDRARDAAAHTVTCHNVGEFSTWAIAGEGAFPTRLRILTIWPAMGVGGGALLLALACVAVYVWGTKDRPRIQNE